MINGKRNSSENVVNFKEQLLSMDMLKEKLEFLVFIPNMITLIKKLRDSHQTRVSLDAFNALLSYNSQGPHVTRAGLKVVIAHPRGE